MGSPNQLSFLPDDYLERKVQRRTNAICAVLFLLVMGGIASAFTLSERATRRVEEQYTKVEAQYLAEAQRLQQVRELQDKQKRMAHQAELTASLLEKVPRSNILAEITNALPAGVSLLDLMMDSKVRPKSAANDAPKTAYEQKKDAKAGATAAPPVPEAKLFDVTVKVSGVAQTDVQVAQLINRLSRSKLFRDVNLLISDEYSLNGDKLRKFQIELMIDPAADVHAQESSGTNVTTVDMKPEQ